MRRVLPSERVRLSWFFITTNAPLTPMSALCEGEQKPEKGKMTATRPSYRITRQTYLISRPRCVCLCGLMVKANEVKTICLSRDLASGPENWVSSFGIRVSSWGFTIIRGAVGVFVFCHCELET